MNFEMYASKTLLSKYLNDYLDEVHNIQVNQHEVDLTGAGHLLTPVCDVIFNHMICIGKSTDEAYEGSKKENILVKLNECIQNKSYSEEELNHIYCYDWIDFDKPLLDIALKRYFFEVYDAKTIEELARKLVKEKNDMAKQYDEDSPGDLKSYNETFAILNKSFETKKDVVEKIIKKFDERFLKEFNCGGYALELFDWVDCNDRNHDRTVDRILANPSVRLLGDTKLSDDEYLVVLDATTYHFIKQKDGKFVEKMRQLPNK